MPAPPELAVGVVLFRTDPEELRRCLRSLSLAAREPGTPSLRVLLRDQSPDASLRELAEAVGLGDAYSFAEGANPGFGAGQNALMAAAFGAGAQAHLCLNPDALLHPEALAALWRAHRSDPGAGLLEAQQFPSEHAKAVDPDSGATPWCSGCALLVPRTTWERVGGFDERFFLYGEDVDLSWRVRAAGLGCRLVPEALVLHHVDDRPPDVGRHAQLLRASALLGAKYGDRAYVEFCLGDLRTLRQAPPTLPPFEEPTPALRAVADFAHRFSFAEPRW